MPNDIIKTQRGYIALVTVLLISAVALLVGISANLLSISESQMGLQKNQGSKAYYLANLCAEDALFKLKENLSYAGNETLFIGDGSCYIYEVEGSGNQNRVIKTTGSISKQTRKMKVEIAQVNPKMKIKTWQEIADF